MFLSKDNLHPDYFMIKKPAAFAAKNRKTPVISAN